MHLRGLLRSTIFLIYIYISFVKLHWSWTAKKKKRKNSICKSCSSVSPHSNRKCFYLFWEFITNWFTWSCSRNKLSLKTTEEGSRVSGGKACCSKSFPWRPQFCIYEFREGQKSFPYWIKKKRCVHCSKRSAKHSVSHHLVRKAWALATCLNCPFVKCNTPLFFSWALNIPTKEKDWKFAPFFGRTPLFLGHYIQFV